MLAEYLEKEASHVKTAADQFREIISTIDKVAKATTDTEKNPASEYLSPGRVETMIFSEERSAPGGVTDMILKNQEVPRTAEATNNPEVPPPAPPEDGQASYQSAKGDGPVPQPDPLKTDPASNPVLKTATAKPGGIIDRLRRGYRLGRSQSLLKGVESGTARIKIRNKAGNVIDVIEPGAKADDPIVKWLREAKGSGKAGEVGRHVGKHQEKYVAGGVVGGTVAATAAGSHAAKNREKGKTKKGSFAETVEKLASRGQIRTLEDWHKEAALKPPKVVGSQLRKAFKDARKIGKPDTPKQPRVNLISGFGTGGR